MSISESAWEDLVGKCIENQKVRHEHQPDPPIKMLILSDDEEIAIIDSHFDGSATMRSLQSKIENLVKQCTELKEERDSLERELDELKYYS